MKILFIFSVTLLLSSLILSCSKRSNEIPGTGNDSSLTHKWNIVYDSTYEGVGAGNHLVTYSSKPGDYFDFRSDSNLYIKEGAKMYTLPFSVITDYTLTISGFGITVNGIPPSTFVTGLDNHHVTLTAPYFYTPGGTFGRKVQLIR